VDDILDKTLGLLKYDEDRDSYIGQTPYRDREIRLRITADEPDCLESMLATLKDVLAEIDSVARKAEDFAIEKLLPLKNELWLDEDEEPVTDEEFRSRMTLTAISIFGDGTTEFWHDDGDLFWGHLIQVERAANGEFTDANIPG
jgi:hypothetical protein